MCTCGIDIATQQATPATHSSACSAFGAQPERPRGAGDAAGGADAAAGGMARGGRRRRRSTSASGSIVARQNDADADVGLRASRAVVDEVLQSPAATRRRRRSCR